jgi:hypothetical protein
MWFYSTLVGMNFFVKRSTYDALKDERDSYKLALITIADRVNRIRNTDQAERSLTEIENTLNIVLVDVHEQP